MQITDYLTLNDIRVFLKSNNKNDIIKEMVEIVHQNHPDFDKNKAIKNILKREQLETTGIGNGVALPHASIEDINNIYVAMGLLKDNAKYNSLDDKPVKLVILMLCPKDKINLQLRFLARVSRLLHITDLKKKLTECKSANNLYDTLKKYENTHFH